MPLIRKIIDIGKTSRAGIIPKSWLTWEEDRLGRKITHVCIETDTLVHSILKIYPYTGK